MIFYDNRLLADNSREISYLFFSKIRKMSQNLSSAAVLIGALRVNNFNICSSGTQLFVEPKVCVSRYSQTCLKQAIKGNSWNDKKMLS